MLTALFFMHSRNILFRDTKPSNVLWSAAAGTAKVIDFDISTFFAGEKLHRRYVGTDGYMAPEQLAIREARKKKVR